MRMFQVVTFSAVVALASVAFGQQQGQWISLFDGKTLNGWVQHNGTAKYEVKDGAIVGHTTEGSPNSFLCTVRQFGDFELEFEVKCDTGLNSGVQIRSRQKTAGDVPQRPKGKKRRHNESEGRVFGPQVEIEASPGQAGYIYGEAIGLGWLSPEPRSDDPSVNSHSFFKNDQWNHYRVIARGPHIQTFINGHKIADLTHEGIYKTHPKGFIGLQVHRIPKGKGPYQVAWRNIRIRELK